MILQTFIEIPGQIITALYKIRLSSPLEDLDCKQNCRVHSMLALL